MGYLVAGSVMLNVGVVGQVLFTAPLLVGYWLLMMYVPFAGHARGHARAGCQLALAVDEFVLGRFRDGTTYTWVLSGMTFTATVCWACLPGTCCARDFSRGEVARGSSRRAWPAWRAAGRGPSGSAFRSSSTFGRAR